MKNSNTILIALVNSKKDFELIKTMNWYRIPVKSAPPIVKNKEIEIIAFYHTKIFQQEKYSIKYYSIVNKVSIVKRKDLFPNDILDVKSENDYFKIEFGQLDQLKTPIISLRGRRIVFISTSEEKFFLAKEINHLFNDSKLEDLIWERFEKMNITSERQFFYSVGKNKYILDFAIFCKTGNINVECDGDEYHTKKLAVQYDKDRNNLLESKGWSVLRFTTHSLTYKLEETLNIVCETINKYGGVQGVGNNEYHYIKTDHNSQLSLFD